MKLDMLVSQVIHFNNRTIILGQEDASQISTSSRLDGVWLSWKSETAAWTDGRSYRTPGPCNCNCTTSPSNEALNSWEVFSVYERVAP